MSLKIVLRFLKKLQVFDFEVGLRNEGRIKVSPIREQVRRNKP
jgi:hypothetical protein